MLTPQQAASLEQAIESAISTGFARVAASGGFGGLPPSPPPTTRTGSGVTPGRMPVFPGSSMEEVEAVLATSEKGVKALDTLSKAFLVGHEKIVEQQSTSAYRAFTDITRNYGVTAEELISAINGDINQITNASERAAVDSFNSYREQIQKFSFLEGFDEEEIRYRNKPW